MPRQQKGLDDEADLMRAIAKFKTLGGADALGCLHYFAKLGFCDPQTFDYIAPAARAQLNAERLDLRRRMGLDAPVVGIRKDHRGRNEYGVIYGSENTVKRERSRRGGP